MKLILIVATVLALAGTTSTVFAQETPEMVKERAEKIVIDAWNTYEGAMEKDPRGAAHEAIERVLEAQKLFNATGLSDPDFTETTEHFLNALRAVEQFAIANEARKAGNESGMRQAMNKACTYGALSPMTDVKLLYICRVFKKNEPRGRIKA